MDFAVAPDIALLADRLALGAFFAISGFHKLVNPQRHATMRQTLVADNVPLVKVNEWLVPTVEFSAGCATVIGLLSPLAALGLLCICLVATCADGVKRIKDWAPIDEADWLDDLLYLPEVLLLVLCLTVLLCGPGAYSVDHFIF